MQYLQILKKINIRECYLKLGIISVLLSKSEKKVSHFLILGSLRTSPLKIIELMNELYKLPTIPYRSFIGWRMEKLNFK